MKSIFTKIALVVIAFIAIFLLAPKLAGAQSSASLWKLQGTTLQSINSTWGLKVPGINTTGTTRCLNINSAGLFGVAADDCGTGGGGDSGIQEGPAQSGTANTGGGGGSSDGGSGTSGNGGSGIVVIRYKFK